MSSLVAIKKFYLLIGPQWCKEPETFKQQINAVRKKKISFVSQYKLPKLVLMQQGNNTSDMIFHYSLVNTFTLRSMDASVRLHTFFSRNRAVQTTWHPLHLLQRGRISLQTDFNLMQQNRYPLLQILPSHRMTKHLLVWLNGADKSSLVHFSMTTDFKKGGPGGGRCVNGLMWGFFVWNFFNYCKALAAICILWLSIRDCQEAGARLEQIKWNFVPKIIWWLIFWNVNLRISRWRQGKIRRCLNRRTLSLPQCACVCCVCVCSVLRQCFQVSESRKCRSKKRRTGGVNVKITILMDVTK